MMIATLLTFMASLSAILFLVQATLAFNMKPSDLQPSPIESGFESLSPALSISAPFFFLSVLFVLFDVELLLLFPSVFGEGLSPINSVNILLLLMVIILMTLLLEWFWSGLSWQC